MIPKPIRRSALLLGMTTALTVAPGSSLTAGSSTASVGDTLRAGDTASMSAVIGSTGCMGLLGLSDSEVQGYQTVFDGPESASSQQRGRERWSEGETKRFDFRRSEIHVLSGAVEITEIRHSGGGCPDRLGLRND